MRNRHAGRVFNNSHKDMRFVDRRGGLNDTMLKRTRYGNNSRVKKRLPGGVALLITFFVLVGVGIGVVSLLNVFQVTSARPDSESGGGAAAVVNSSSTSLGGDDDSAAVPVDSGAQEGNSGTAKDAGGEAADGGESPADNTPAEVPLMPPPPEGSPEYMSKYPEMFVEYPEFEEPNYDEKVAYLTFDDGPCATTNDVLDALDSLEVKATFFVTGLYDSPENVVAKLREIHERGHKLAVHTYEHDYKKIYSSVEAYLDDYKKIDDLILEATGERAKLFRFPGGSNTGYNADIRDDLFREMRRRGFVYHDWNSSNGDSDGISADQQISKAINESQSQNRSIILMHDAPGKAQVAGTLAPIVNALKDSGYRFEIMEDTLKPIQFAKLEPVG